MWPEHRMQPKGEAAFRFDFRPLGLEEKTELRTTALGGRILCFLRKLAFSAPWHILQLPQNGIISLRSKQTDLSNDLSQEMSFLAHSCAHTEAETS
jgi:hypothetical protein